MADVKKIQGNYFCQANVTASYTLTGANRQAGFDITGDKQQLLCRCINAPIVNAAVVFPVEHIVNIRRIRLIANGGQGIQAAINHNAAEFLLAAMRTDADSNLIVYDRCPVIIPNWGEWFAINMELSPFKRLDDEVDFDYVGLGIEKTGIPQSMFNVDDYNIQDDYVNQGITPVLQMGLETSGLVCQTNGQWF